LTCLLIASRTGENGSPQKASRVLRIEHGQADRVVFPPREVAQVKAVACELPKTHGPALSRFSRSEIHRFVVEHAVSDASASTIGRWLADDAIRPWQHRSWIFPRDPDFLEKAGSVLDLYARRWEGKLLEPGDMVISADAKPSIQARKRVHPSAPPAPGRGQRVEHEYERRGALTYFDAWDVRRGGVIGRSEGKGGIAPFDRLVWQVMTKEPYASAPRVFWIVDNGSDHRGKASITPRRTRTRISARARRLTRPNFRRGALRDRGALPLEPPGRASGPVGGEFEHRRVGRESILVHLPSMKLAPPFWEQDAHAIAPHVGLSRSRPVRHGDRRRLPRSTLSRAPGQPAGDRRPAPGRRAALPRLSAAQRALHAGARVL